MVKYSSRWPWRTRSCRVGLAIAIQSLSRHRDAVHYPALRKGAVSFLCGVVGNSGSVDGRRPEPFEGKRRSHVRVLPFISIAHTLDYQIRFSFYWALIS